MTVVSSMIFFLLVASNNSIEFWDVSAFAPPPPSSHCMVTNRYQRRIIHNKGKVGEMIPTATTYHPFHHPEQTRNKQQYSRSSSSSCVGRRNTNFYSFMGSDGGFLGIGTPELFTILLVGYFVLGPSELFKLTKEIGKLVQNVRSFATEATTTLETNFENQLQLEEIRKAQKELTDAFSFRRSINVDEDSEAFEVNAKSPRRFDEMKMTASVPTASTATTTTTESGTTTTLIKKKKKKRVRRVKKKQQVEDPFRWQQEEEKEEQQQQQPSQKLANNVPDLVDDEMLSNAEWRAMESVRVAQETLAKEAEEEKHEEQQQPPPEKIMTPAQQAAAQTRWERKERFMRGAQEEGNQSSSSSDDEAAASGGGATAAEQSRFQQQLSGNWNNEILSNNNDKLNPFLATIMERLAVLEEEKIAADQRLQEEFRLREENEERYYRQKRRLLEEAAAEVQASAYASTSTTTPRSVEKK